MAVAQSTALVSVHEFCVCLHACVYGSQMRETLIRYFINLLIRAEDLCWPLALSCALGVNRSQRSSLTNKYYPLYFTEAHL